MSRVPHPFQKSCSVAREAFSLLEVILATAILSSSTVMLLGLLSTGEHHARQAEHRVLGQMLCQSKLEELLAAPALGRTVDREPIDGYPEWVFSQKETPTKLAGLVRWHISVTWVDPARKIKLTDETSRRTTFELVRLQRMPANPLSSRPGGLPDAAAPADITPVIPPP